MKEKRQKNAKNKQGMMTVRVEGQGGLAGGAQNKGDDATNPEANNHRAINRHVNDAVSHIDIDARRIDFGGP